MHRIDDSWDGFKWLNVNDKERSAVAVMRTGADGGSIVCAVNFTPQPYLNYRIGLPFDCELTEILNSDRAEYGGSNLYNGTVLRAENLRRIKAGAVIIWLDTAFDIILQEIGNAERPLVKGKPVEAIRALYDERRPLYAAAADIVFPITSTDYDRVICQLADRISETVS